MYTEKPTTFDALIAPFSATVQETARWLRELIVDTFPQLAEDVYGGTKVANALYSVGAKDRVALGIQPGPKAVKLFIHDPEHLGDPPFKLEGKGRHMRHIKFTSAPRDQRAALVALMRIPVERRS